MNKSEITKNLKQIKKLLEEDSSYTAKERVGFLINDIEKERLYRSNQGRTDKQVENNYKILHLVCNWFDCYISCFIIIPLDIVGNMNRIPDVVVVHKRPQKMVRYFWKYLKTHEQMISLTNKRKPLVPNENEILEIGIGISFVERYKKKYKL